MQVNLLNNTQTNFLFFICKNVDVKSKKQLRVGNMKNLISLPNLQKQNKYILLWPAVALMTYVTSIGYRYWLRRMTHEIDETYYLHDD
jgi:hypothetical protein